MKEIHVSINGNDITGSGSINNPFRNIQYALNYIEPGSNVIIHNGIYEPFVISKEASGTKDNKVTIKSADNERAIIQGIHGEFSVTVHMVNVDNITIDGLEVIGGGLGIYYVSDNSIGNKTLENITITNCIVHGIRGMHGIAVYAKNDLAPIRNLIMKNCEVYDCRLDSSESTVFNGNIDGFEICNNVVHDNNNIGIDMIGFEGKALHDDSYNGNIYDVDFCRNGICHNNFVYNISAFDNEAYFENPLAAIKDTKGEYNLCANGIYVDGAQSIKIYDNFIYNCDIGIEVATEHSPDDNELFKVGNVDVYNNVVCNCIGYSGLGFGGYAKNLGFTEGCNFYNNSFIDNNIGMIVQRSKDNNIKNNIFAGGQLGIEFNHDVLIQDQVNNFENNVFCTNIDTNNYFDLGSKDLNYLMKDNLNKQIFTSKRCEYLDGCKSVVNDIGSKYIPNKEQLDNYNKYMDIGTAKIKETADYLLSIYAKGLSISSILEKDYNICNYLNRVLNESGFNAYVELIKTNNANELFNIERYENNGDINPAYIDNIKDDSMILLHLRYCYDNNSWAHKEVDINIVK